MKYINKNDIITMALIIAFSVIIAILYNFLRSDKCSGKIPFFKTPIEERLVSDDDLFGNITAIKKEDVQKSNVIEEIADNIKEDTLELDSAINTTTIINTDTLDYAMLLNESKKSGVDNFGAISINQMKKIANDTLGNFIIVDARRPEDYKESCIGNAINIFPYVDDESVVVEKVLALPKSKTIIVYCDGGDCDSSHKVGEILQTFGYKFFIFEGGWEEWSK